MGLLSGITSQIIKSNFKRHNIDTMNVGAMLFNQPLPFVVELDGDIEGINFSVRGKGVGNGSTGRLEGKFICTTGDLPVPWTSVVSSVAYGIVCFTKYPKDLKDFYKSCFPEGYVQERTIEYENDGTFTTRAELTYENGIIYNRITMNGKGFAKGGNILGKKLEFGAPNPVVYVYPDDNGIRCTYNKIYKIIGGGYQVSRTSQRNFPRSSGPILIPKVHHHQVGLHMSKDPEESKDHMILVETLNAVDCDKYFTG